MAMCMEERKSKGDDMIHDKFQRKWKVRLEDPMTKAMPEIGTCVGDDWARGNHLDNQRIASGAKVSLGYL